MTFASKYKSTTLSVVPKHDHTVEPHCC